MLAIAAMVTGMLVLKSRERNQKLRCNTKQQNINCWSHRHKLIFTPFTKNKLLRKKVSSLYESYASLKYASLFCILCITLHFTLLKQKSLTITLDTIYLVEKLIHGFGLLKQ